MAANKFYSYYLRGGQIALIEQDINDDNRWKSPASTVADGLEIEYTYSPTNAIIDETDTIDLPEYLAKGLVYYVQGKLAEDQGDIERKEYFMREFRRILEKHESSKIRGPRMMIPGSHGIR